MKIIIFIENQYRGGLDTFVHSLISHWPVNVQKFELICNKGHSGAWFLSGLASNTVNIVLHRLPIYPEIVSSTSGNAVLTVLRKLLAPFLRYGIFLLQLISLAFIFRSYRNDQLLVVNGGHPGGDSCRAAVLAWSMFSSRPPAIYNFHNLSSSPKWFYKYFETIIDHFLFKNAAKIVGVSQACCDSLPKKVLSALNDKATYVYNGVALPADVTIDTDLVRRRIGIPETAEVCLFMATYEKRKGHEFLIKSFNEVAKSIPNSFLVICGYGTEEEIKFVKKLVLQFDLSDRILLLGFQENPEELIMCSQVLLVASQCFESFGLTIVEAMARSIPVVATNVGGIPEVIEQGHGGFCFALDDVEGYSNKIIELLKKPKLRAKVGSAGFTRYQNLFTANLMSENYARILQQNLIASAQKEKL